jgi:hypothetical protein
VEDARMNMTDGIQKPNLITARNPESAAGWFEKVLTALRQGIAPTHPSRIRNARLMGLYFSDTNGKSKYSQRVGQRERVQR